MTRLPTPGSDDNTWGEILNDFLSVAHNSDGTLKDTTGVPDADGSTKGKVQLAGDLGGSAGSPQVTSTSLSSALPINQGGTNATTASAALNNLLPSQTGNNGKMLSTNGSSASWTTVSSGVTDHGALTGLSDDDHTQYALADGSRGNFDAAGAASTAQTNAINTAQTALDTHKISNDHKFYLHTIRAETSADISAYSGAQTIDGVSVVVGDHVLSTADAKVYLVNSGTWTIDTAYNAENVIFIIGEGDTNKGHIWRVNGSGSSVGYEAAGILDANARVNVLKENNSVGTRRAINFHEGTNITISASDDSVNEEVDITISASGAASGLNLNHYYEVNTYYLFGNISTSQASSAVTLSANKLYANKLVVFEDCDVSGGWFYNGTALAGGLFQYGVYAAGSDGLPTGTPLIQSGEADLSAAAYLEQTWATVTLTAGVYWLVYWTNTSLSLRKCNTEPVMHGSTRVTPNPYLGYVTGTNTYSSVGLPDIASISGTFGGSASIARPYIMFKVTG